MAATASPPRTTRRRSKATLAIEVPTGIGRLSTAATTKLKDVEPRHFERKEWQEEAYGHTIAIGELGYVVSVFADVVSRGGLVVTETDLDTGDMIVPAKTEDGADITTGDREVAEKALLALRGPGGDWSHIMRSAAEADIIAGEGHLIGVPLDAKGQISWEFLSVMEIEQDKTGGREVVRRRHAKHRTSSTEKEVLPPETYVARYHRRDAQFSGDATSALRRVAASCREVVLLTQLIEATIKSHIPAGILIVADELSVPALPEESSGDEDVDPLLEILTEHLSAPIEDRRSAASLVPLLLNAPAEIVDKALYFLKIDPERMDPERVISLRNDALGRIATGLDVPPEVMQGLGGLNHWTGATVSKDFVEKHVVPAGERLAMFLTISYLRRILIDAEGWEEARAERFSLEFDPGVLLTRADAAQSADTLYRDGILSKDARLRAHGFDPDEDRPGEEERHRRYLEKMALATSVGNKAFLPALGLTVDRLVELGMDPEAAEAMLTPGAGPAGGSPEDQVEAGAEGVDDEDQQQEGETGGEPGGTEEPVGTGPEEFAALTAMIRTAGSASLVRALEKAANLALSKLPRESMLVKDQVRSLPKLKVLAAIPRAEWGKMRVEPEGMLTRAWDEFRGLSVFWIRQYFEGVGVDHLAADERAHRITSSIVQDLDRLALSAFRRPPVQGRDGLYVPAGLVLDAFETVLVAA